MLLLFCDVMIESTSIDNQPIFIFENMLNIVGEPYQFILVGTGGCDKKLGGLQGTAGAHTVSQQHLDHGLEGIPGWQLPRCYGHGH